mmetsp:Transcript_14219/g.20734  ORF Transcript_14219/g.20734 Transcript_14219/m.20734 type:complete len:222 (-) Transcript_14219:871-1536(-)
MLLDLNFSRCSSIGVKTSNSSWDTEPLRIIPLVMFQKEWSIGLRAALGELETPNPCNFDVTFRNKLARRSSKDFPAISAVAVASSSLNRVPVMLSTDEIFSVTPRHVRYCVACSILGSPISMMSPIRESDERYSRIVGTNPSLDVKTRTKVPSSARSLAKSCSKFNTSGSLRASLAVSSITMTAGWPSAFFKPTAAFEITFSTLLVASKLLAGARSPASAK